MPFARICQRDECVRVWKQLARELALSNQEIERIEQSYPSKHERCLRCLEQWAATQTDADFLSLAIIIRTLGFKSLARMCIIEVGSSFSTELLFLGEIESMA
jgi:hypothetical protein